MRGGRDRASASSLPVAVVLPTFRSKSLSMSLLLVGVPKQTTALLSKLRHRCSIANGFCGTLRDTSILIHMTQQV